MTMRSLILILVLLSASAVAFAQPENLIKNSNGDGDGKEWQAYGNAKIERCAGGGNCFVLREGGYLIQDVDVSENAVGQYALLIGRAHGERKAGASITGRPYLHGYMMNGYAGVSGGRIYGYLSGQQMSFDNYSPGQWGYLWGVFRIPPGTGRIRLFLQQGQSKNVPHDGSRASFDDLGVYVFPTEQDALVYVAQRTPVQAGSRKPLDPMPQCLYRRASIPPLYGIQLGMSLDEIVSLFPGSNDQPNVHRTLEQFKKYSKALGVKSVVIDNRAKILGLSEINQVVLHFRDQRLFSFSVHSSSPKWENVDKFIAERGDLLNLVGVNGWNSTEGNSSIKYLMCESIEIRFYASPVPASNPNAISITDTAIEAKEFSALHRP